MSDQPPADPPNPPPADPPADPPASGAEGSPPPEPSGRPEGVPDDLWTETGLNTERLSQYRAPAADAVEAADKYVLPSIEGLELTEIENAPTVQLLRSAAFEAGIGQEGFAKIFTEHVQAQIAEGDAYADKQRQLLGENATQRMTALSQTLDGRLPKELAEALREVAVDAKVVEALEKLTSGAPPPRGDLPPPPTGQTKTREEIRGIMQSPAYTGKGGLRDPAVVKLVDDWFETEAKLDAAKAKA